MKKSILLSLALLATSLTAAESEKAFNHEFHAYDTPVNYNYGEFFVGQSNTETIDDSALIIAGGGEGMITKNWIYNLYYTGGMLDGTFYGTDYTVDTNLLKFGGSYRFALMEKLDLLVGADLIYGWNKTSVGDISDNDSDFGFGAKTSLRYGFTPKFEGLLGLDVGHLYDSTSTSVTASLTYYFNSYVGLSGRVVETFDDLNTFTYGASVRLRF